MTRGRTAPRNILDRHIVTYLSIIYLYIRVVGVHTEYKLCIHHINRIKNYRPLDHQNDIYLSESLTQAHHPKSLR